MFVQGAPLAMAARMIYHAVPNLTFWQHRTHDGGWERCAHWKSVRYRCADRWPLRGWLLDASTTYLQTLGCSDADLSAVTVAPGIDVHTAERMVARQCGIDLPRTQGDSYIGILDECGYDSQANLQSHCA